MFDFLKKYKKINTLNIKEFNGAISAIEVYIAISEWQKAKRAIDEILKKEEQSLLKLIEKINQTNDDNIKTSKIIEKEKAEFDRKKFKIQSLKKSLEKAEISYNKKIEKDRFKIRFKKIKEEIDNLIGNKKSIQAMRLLQKFAEENKEKTLVISFYNKEKSRIQVNIEKQRKLEQYKIRSNTRTEALNLIGETVRFDNQDEKDINYFKKLFKKVNFYKTLKESIKKKKLLDEINLLIEESSKVNDEIAEKRLENIHKGLVKEISKNKMIGYDIYGKILGADKISGDTFGMEELDDRYLFFIGDATGHGIKAGFIITLISKFFRENLKKTLKELVFSVNNGLKQDLQSRNFITGIFFEINKKLNNVSYVGMGHEPMLIYRKKENKIEKIIPGGLAAGIRIIKSVDDVKIKNINLEDGDLVLTYSDGVIENKSIDGKLYGLDRLIENFNLVCKNEDNIKNIYEYLINDLKLFSGGTNFRDDVTIILLKKDISKNIVSEDDEYLNEIKVKEGLANREINMLKGKTKQEIEKELENIRRKKETERLLKSLETLYYTGEVLKLKEEAIRFIKEGYIHKKINFYLRKAIENEKKYKVEQKNQKMKNKYNVLKELYKKGEYKTVIKEVEDIIIKDGNI